jgi:hypothetical protein
MATGSAKRTVRLEASFRNPLGVMLTLPPGNEGRTCTALLEP